MFLARSRSFSLAPSTSYSPQTKSMGHQHVLEPELRTKEGAKNFAHHLLAKAAKRLRRGDYYCRRLGMSLSWLGGKGAGGMTSAFRKPTTPDSCWHGWKIFGREYRRSNPWRSAWFCLASFRLQDIKEICSPPNQGMRNYRPSSTRSTNATDATPSALAYCRPPSQASKAMPHFRGCRRSGSFSSTRSHCTVM